MKNQTNELLDKVSAEVKLLHAAAAELFERWKIQGIPTRVGGTWGASIVFIGRREGISGLIFVNKADDFQAATGASLELKVALLNQANELFTDYGKRAKAFWKSLELLPGLGGITGLAVTAAEEEGPQR